MIGEYHHRRCPIIVSRRRNKCNINTSQKQSLIFVIATIFASYTNTTEAWPVAPLPTALRTLSALKQNPQHFKRKTNTFQINRNNITPTTLSEKETTTTPPEFLPSTNQNQITLDTNNSGLGGIYGPFAEYAWKTLQNNGLYPSHIPQELSHNDALAKGPGGLRVQIDVQALAARQEPDDDDGETCIGSSVRLARYALLQTTSPEDKTTALQMNGMHVLNLVIFPSISTNVPLFGADLVSLPGNKHLIAIDFQPIQENDDDDRRLAFPNKELLARLRNLHEKHVLSSENLPWGGDIPDFAQRFFSPYALWTRLNCESVEDSIEVIRSEVMDCFVDYLDLYVDVLKEAVVLEDKEVKDVVECGQRDYLTYRRDNDPARPMLKSLYGEEWTERLINESLFKPL